MDKTQDYNPLRTISTSLSEAFSSTPRNIQSSIKENFNAIFSSKYIYFGLIIVIIVCVLLAYTLYYIISSRIFSLAKAVSEDTLTPVLCNTKRKFNFTFDKTSNGDRRSFTFWMYIHDMSKYRNMYKNVFSISDTSDIININKSSPFVFLDKNQNRLYVRFAERNQGDTYQSIMRYADLTNSSLLDSFMAQGIVVPYIPLQRWVHIAIVCNANSYKNYIYAYVDGDLVNTTSTGELDKIKEISSTPKDLKNIDLNIQGFLNIGGTPNDYSDGPGFAGLVSKITTYNYELNQQDIYEDYYKGPIGGMLSTIGLANYGLRSPIYRIN